MLLSDDLLFACQARGALRFDASGRRIEALGDLAAISTEAVGSMLCEVDRALSGVTRGQFELPDGLGLAWERTAAGDRIAVLFDARSSLALVRSRLRALCRSTASIVDS